MSFLKKIVTFILALESRLILRKYKPFVVAVTGSVGKTSTKDAVFCVLKRQAKFARKSEKSLNSEIGLPLTVIGAPNAWRSLVGWVRNIVQGARLLIGRNEYPDCLVLEVGADHPGDIKKVVKWLRPDIAVITKVSDTPVHVEFFNSPRQVFEEKAALAHSVKNGGSLVLFADDEKVFSLGGKLTENPSVSKITVLTFGEKSNATVRGFDYEIEGMNEGISFKVNFGGWNGGAGGRVETVKIKGVIGAQHMFPLLAAAAVGKARDMSVDEIMRGLYDYEPPRGRMNLLEGINGSTIIDDSYNSSPDATSLAIQTLKEAKCAGKRLAILGDMMELGKYSAEEHRKIGREISKVANVLITVGPRARGIAEEALENGMTPDSVRSFDDSNDATPYAVSIAQSGDVILVKGSQSVRIERIVKALLKEPEKAAKLLVRQEEEWLRKL